MIIKIVVKESELVRLLNGDFWEEEDQLRATILLRQGCDLRRVRPHIEPYGQVRLRLLMNRSDSSSPADDS